MSEEFVSHIFEPFERERNSTISRIQGTGLGMAITKNIVDMMKRSISVSSDRGWEPSSRSPSPSAGQRPRMPPDHHGAEGLRALVVDDDSNTCDSVSYMLQQIGLRASGPSPAARRCFAPTRPSCAGVTTASMSSTG